MLNKYLHNVQQYDHGASAHYDEYNYGPRIFFCISQTVDIRQPADELVVIDHMIQVNSTRNKTRPFCKQVNEHLVEYRPINGNSVFFVFCIVFCFMSLFFVLPWQQHV